jgi:hypothetical protein
MHFNLTRSFPAVAAAALASCFLPACGSSQNSQVTVSSLPFNSALAAQSAGVSVAPSPAPSASASPVPITDFRVCIARIVLHGRQMQPVPAPSPSVSPSPGEDGDEDMDAVGFAPGLIDLSSGGTVDWGQITIPKGFRIDGIRAKVHKDKALCGQDFSLSFNGLTTSEDIELKWRFNPPLQFDGSTTQLQLSMNEMLTAFERAVVTRNPASLKSDGEGAEGSASCR